MVTLKFESLIAACGPLLWRGKEGWCDRELRNPSRKTRPDPTLVIGHLPGFTLHKFSFQKHSPASPSHNPPHRSMSLPVGRHARPAPAHHLASSHAECSWLFFEGGNIGGVGDTEAPREKRRWERWRSVGRRLWGGARCIGKVSSYVARSVFNEKLFLFRSRRPVYDDH